MDCARRRISRPRGGGCLGQSVGSPENPSYQLRRLWIDEPAFSAYYGGFSNEGLWPLCHMVDVRPQFRSEDGRRIRTSTCVLPLRSTSSQPHRRSSSTTTISRSSHRRCARRPDARTALFWHIPWPYPDRLRICPWRQEILTGLLANDLLAFQLERDRRNFLLAVEDSWAPKSRPRRPKSG